MNTEARERPPVPERRASSLSQEEIQQGIEIRKKALKSPDVDLGRDDGWIAPRHLLSITV